MTRRNWAAALVSLVLPGSGQLLNGRARRGGLYLGAWILALVAGATMFLLLPWPLRSVVPVVAAAVVLLGASVDAAIDGSAKPSASPLPSLPLGIGAALAITAVLVGWYLVQRVLTVQTFQVQGRSMEPTVLRGDRVLVDKSAYGLRNPITGRWLWRRQSVGRGDIVTYLYPTDHSRVFIHRVVGLPGETLELRERAMLVDGKALDEPYVQFLEAPDDDGRSREGWGPEVVPAGHLFLLGDNRDNARDSRYHGFVPVDDVLGEVKVVYLSIDPDRLEVRPERSFHPLH